MFQALNRHWDTTVYERDVCLPSWSLQSAGQDGQSNEGNNQMRTMWGTEFYQERIIGRVSLRN